MKRLFLLGTLSLMICSMQASITLDSCRSMARRNYPEIRQYGLVSLAEQYNVSNAVRAWIPQIRFTAQASWQTEAAAFPEELNQLLTAMGTSMDGIRQDQYKLQLDLQQTIWDGGAATANKRIAQAQAHEQQVSIDVDFYNLDSRVDNLYFGILLLEDQMQQTQMLIDLLNENLATVRSLVRNEVMLQSEADAVEVEVISANQKREQMRASLDSYRQMLSLIVGRDVRMEELERPALEYTSRQGSQRPELTLLEAKSDVLSAQKKLIRSASMPQFYAYAQGWYGYPGLDMFENMQNADWSWNAVIGVRMSWNIGAYYTQSNRLKQLEVSNDQLAVQKEVFNFNNNLSMVQLQGEINRLEKTIDDDERIVALRKSVRQAAESQVKNGTLSTTELLSKITDENQAALAKSLHEIELLQKVHEYNSTKSY